MSGRPRGEITVARLRAIEISLNWRWVPVLVLATWLLAHAILPARFPAWEIRTNWLLSAAAVLAGEAALLVHEVSHALLARRRGQEVTRIIFHGLRAETVVGEGVPAPAHEALIALVGPGVNVVLAGLAWGLRLVVADQGPLDVFLLTQVLGNAAMALMSLVPLSGSDGARALSAFRRARLRRRESGEAEVAGQRQDKHDQDEQAKRRPAVIAPSPRHAETASQ